MCIVKKTNFLVFLSLATSLLLSGCKNELVTIESWKEIPVIYGILSLGDTATYIRVEKAFVDATKSPNDIAQIPDSLYSNDVTVSLIRTKNNERFNLTRVDGNTEGYKRDGGIFAQSPNYLYKAKNATLSMRGDEQWRIVIQRVTCLTPTDPSSQTTPALPPKFRGRVGTTSD